MSIFFIYLTLNLYQPPITISAIADVLDIQFYFSIFFLLWIWRPINTEVIYLHRLWSRVRVRACIRSFREASGGLGGLPPDAETTLNHWAIELSETDRVSWSVRDSSSLGARVNLHFIRVRQAGASTQEWNEQVGAFRVKCSPRIKGFSSHCRTKLTRESEGESDWATQRQSERLIWCYKVRLHPHPLFTGVQQK